MTNLFSNLIYALVAALIPASINFNYGGEALSLWFSYVSILMPVIQLFSLDSRRSVILNLERQADDRSYVAARLSTFFLALVVANLVYLLTISNDISIYGVFLSVLLFKLVESFYEVFYGILSKREKYIAILKSKIARSSWIVVFLCSTFFIDLKYSLALLATSSYFNLFRMRTYFSTAHNFRWENYVSSGVRGVDSSVSVIYSTLPLIFYSFLNQDVAALGVLFQISGFARLLISSYAYQYLHVIEIKKITSRAPKKKLIFLGVVCLVAGTSASDLLIKSLYPGVAINPEVIFLSLLVAITNQFLFILSSLVLRSVSIFHIVVPKLVFIIFATVALLYVGYNLTGVMLVVISIDLIFISYVAWFYRDVLI